MQLGLGSYAYAWAIGIAGYPPSQPMTAVGLIQRSAELGVRVVQIADNLPLYQLSHAEIAQVEQAARRLGIQIEVGARGISPPQLTKHLELTQRFGSPILRVVVDTADQHPTPEEIVTTLRAMMPSFEAAGVTLAIENHDRFKVHTLVDIVRQVESSHIGICLDTVNSFGAGEGPAVVIAALAPYVVNLHVKDFTIRRHHHMLGFEIEGTPAGKGMLDVPALLDTLSRLGRDCNAILETWPPPEPSVEQTILKEDSWVWESIHYLRTLIKE